MANTNLDIVVRAKDEASKSFGKISGNIKQMGAVMAVAGAAIVGGLALAVKAANEQIKQETQLNAVLTSTKNVAGLTAEEVKRIASSLQNVTAVGDEVILAGQNMLLSFTQIGKEVFPQATETLLDMATAMNNGATPSAEQLSSQAIQLGKALNDPLAGLSSLARVGVKFTDEQKKLIKAMVGVGDVAGAQKVILGELSTEFGGRARAAAQTYEGQLTQLQNTWGDILEQIGMIVLPMLQKVTDFIKPILEKLATWISENPKLAQTILTVVAVLGPLLVILPILVAMITALFSPITLIIGAIALLVTAGVLLAKNWDYLKGVARSAWNAIAEVIGGVIERIKNAVASMVNNVTAKLNSIIALANRAISMVNRVPGISIGTIPSIPALASGGIVSSPTLAMIGEAGPEAVVPLNRKNGRIGGTTVNISIGSFFGGDPERAAREIGDLIIKRLQLNASVS